MDISPGLVGLSAGYADGHYNDLYLGQLNVRFPLVDCLGDRIKPLSTIDIQHNHAKKNLLEACSSVLFGIEKEAQEVMISILYISACAKKWRAAEIYVPSMRHGYVRTAEEFMHQVYWARPYMNALHNGISYGLRVLHEQELVLFNQREYHVMIIPTDALAQRCKDAYGTILEPAVEEDIADPLTPEEDRALDGLVEGLVAVIR